MGAEQVETLIVGGGQAGLSVSHMLRRRGRPHLVLERHRIAERWRTERWNGLRFQFPSWSVQLPEFPFRHADADGFATPEEIVEYLQAYARFVDAPVRCGVEVLAMRAAETGFLAETTDGAITARNVVVATGPYQVPVIPAIRPSEGSVFEVHASAYREPDRLPAGAVLVIGSGASGVQIAEELLRAERRVYLSVSRHRRLPRRYRGHDLTWWLTTLGLDRTPTEQRGPDRILPLITGAYGGHTIDLRDYAAQGMTLLGRIEGFADGGFAVAADAAENIAFGDAAYLAFLDKVDDHVSAKGLALPPEPAARAGLSPPSALLQRISRCSFAETGITAIVWATGYRCDFSWINLPVLDAAGEPIHQRGVARIPGLYFIGLQWLARMNSSFLSGVGEDAAYLADHICARELSPPR